MWTGASKLFLFGGGVITTSPPPSWTSLWITYILYVCSLFKLSVVQPIYLIYRKGYFVHHSLGCTSIYHALSYPLIFLTYSHFMSLSSNRYSSNQYLLRTNCADCLDRTNAVQLFIGKI